MVDYQKLYCELDSAISEAVGILLETQARLGEKYLAESINQLENDNGEPQ